MGRLRKDQEDVTETGDSSALRLMLAYVEAECLRMGATEAARHAALAAALVPGGEHIAVTMPVQDLRRVN